VLAVKKRTLIGPDREKIERNRGKCKLELGKTSDGFDSDDSVINELAEILSIPSPRLQTRREESAVPVQSKQMRKLRILLPRSPLNSLATSRVCFTSRTNLGAKHPRPYKLLV